jgi:c-di-GMP-binding flagellar brake protein YcgR
LSELRELFGSRQYRRVSYKLAVSCMGSFTMFEGRTQNLSINGICLETDGQMEDGSEVSMIFKIPIRSKPFVVCGRVLWSEKATNNGSYNMGLQYLWLSENDKESLVNFLSVFKDENDYPSLMQ